MSARELTNPTKPTLPPPKEGVEEPGGPAMTTVCSDRVPGHLEAECASFPREKGTLTYVEQHDNK